jgi:hypothetical protein
VSSDLDRAIRDTITLLLDQRAADATICPSDVARAIDPTGWRDLMETVRDVAVTEAERGMLEIRQGGTPVSGDAFHGPIRLGRPT